MRRRGSLSLAWIVGLGIFLVGAVGLGGWAGYRFASEALAQWNRAEPAPPVTAPPPTAPATLPATTMATAPPETLASSLPTPTAPPATAVAAPATPAPVVARATPIAAPTARPIETTLAQPPPRVTQPAAPPPPTTMPRAPEPGLAPPQFNAADGRRSAEEAYKDLWSALLRGDGTTAAKYVPTARLKTMRNERAVVADFMGLTVSQVQVGKTQTGGDKAVIFAKATPASTSDDRGRPAPVEVVVRMYRENGYWRVLSQMWLVSTNPDRERQDATAWLKSGPSAGDEHAAAVAAVQARGGRFDADGFQSAVARGDLEQVRLFLQAGMSARTRLRNGASALNLALTDLEGGDASKQDMAIALVRAGADLEERTPVGATPIMRAVVACKPRLIDVLVTAQARLDAKDNDGKTLLDWARANCPSIQGPLKAAGAR